MRCALRSPLLEKDGAALVQCKGVPFVKAVPRLHPSSLALHNQMGKAQAVRVKLEFMFDTGSPSKCLFLVDKRTTQTVSDLVYLLVDKFDLRKSCPHGVFLQVDDYYLPPGQPIAVLRDDETVR